MTRARRIERWIARAVVTVPALGALAAVAWAWRFGVSPLALGLCAALYGLTTLGITAGFHRHFTHRSFQARPGVRRVLGVLGSMAGQGPLLFWVAVHRRHHQHADRPGDPHTPLEGGFWHAHVGWMLDPVPDDWARLVPDLLKDDLTMGLHLRYFAWVAAGLALPGLVGLATGKPVEAVSCLLWGGLMRMFLVHHATWLVNSWCHLWGDRPHDTGDRSTNAWPCALLTLGEAWHNNHHAAPAAARHGRGHWQLDPTYAFIRTLERAGLASHLVGYEQLERRVPAAEPSEVKIER